MQRAPESREIRAGERCNRRMEPLGRSALIGVYNKGLKGKTKNLL